MDRRETGHGDRSARQDRPEGVPAFGAWELGGEWGTIRPNAAIDAIRQARALGINMFDTAQGYGFGASERLVATALREVLDHACAEVVIATKGGLRATPDGLVRDSSPAWLRRGVDESLVALGVEHIDLYQVHWPDPEVPFEESAGALHELVTLGKIRHVGVSNFDTNQMAAFGSTRPVETLAIVGTRNADHVAESVAGADLTFSDADRARIDEVMEGTVPVGGPSPEAMP